MSEAADKRRGQKLRGSGTEWSKLRVARDLSVSELAAASGVPRSIVGLIDQGRLNPSPQQAAAILLVLSGPETL
jgi:transcriptional regulator with XRE-family HTH domain